MAVAFCKGTPMDLWTHRIAIGAAVASLQFSVVEVGFGGTGLGGLDELKFVETLHAHKEWPVPNEK